MKELDRIDYQKINEMTAREQCAHFTKILKEALQLEASKDWFSEVLSLVTFSAEGKIKVNELGLEVATPYGPVQFGSEDNHITVTAQGEKRFIHVYMMTKNYPDALLAFGLSKSKEDKEGQGARVHPGGIEYPPVHYSLPKGSEMIRDEGGMYEWQFRREYSASANLVALAEHIAEELYWQRSRVAQS